MLEPIYQKLVIAKGTTLTGLLRDDDVQARDAVGAAWLLMRGNAPALGRYKPAVDHFILAYKASEPDLFPSIVYPEPTGEVLESAALLDAVAASGDCSI
ncbi:MAG: hypothetical protein GX643_15075 [Acidimicrobiales bacterium]|nr:hypothetical protein [Acidimicrobiales bacterium]